MHVKARMTAFSGRTELRNREYVLRPLVCRYAV